MPIGPNDYPNEAYSALLLITWLILKHFLCDFVFQSEFQLKHKGQYGHSGGLTHMAIHGAGSAPLFFLTSAHFSLVAAVIIAELAIHYHVDWAKQQLGARLGWTPNRPAFWIAIGADQLAHQATYVAMAFALSGAV